MSDDPSQDVMPKIFTYAWPFCLHVSFDDGLAYLATSTKELGRDRRLVVHRGNLGEQMRLVEISSVYEEATGYHLVDFLGDPVLVSIHYPPSLDSPTTLPFLIENVKGWTRFMRVRKDDYEVTYFDDFTARVKLKQVSLPIAVFKRLKQESDGLLQAALRQDEDDPEQLIAALDGVLKLIPEISMMARPIVWGQRPGAGTSVPQSLVSSLVQHKRNFEGPQGRGFSRATDKVFYRGFYELICYILAFDGVKPEPLPF